MDDPRQQAQRAARSAERWATVSMWLSGCALAVWALPFLIAVAVAIWVFLALR